MPSDATYNRIVLVGNVGADPRIKYLEPEVCSAYFSLATNMEGAMDATGRQVIERVTDWHAVLSYRELAQEVELEVRKGMLVRVEGRLTYREWRTHSGEPRRSAVVLADKIEVLSQGKDKQSAPPPTEELSIPYGTYLEHMSQDKSGLPF